MQILFQADLGKFAVDDVLEGIRAQRPDEDWPFIVGLCAGVTEQRATIDQQIATHLTGWTFDRIASIDRIVLRMALYELQFMDTPPSIVINEAVELAKKYGTEESGRFVNGILGAVYREAASSADSWRPAPDRRQAN